MKAIRWLTYLSLDAPLVALAWQELLARQLEANLSTHHRIIIGLSVWLGYAADRWFDGWRYHSTESLRHQLHQKYRWPIFATWFTVLIFAITLSLHSLMRSELVNGLFLMAVSIAITALVQKRVLGPHPHLPKSILTATLVSGSSLLFPLSNSSTCLTQLIPTSLSMIGLFSLNCLLIHKWERAIDHSHNESMPHDQGRPFLIICTLTLLATASTIVTHTPTALPCALSLTLLGLLHKLSPKINLDTRRTLADLSLLSPILFLQSPL